MTIPAGYQLQVTTWENDADAYKTSVVSGLNEVDTRFLIFIAQHFTSKNASKNPGLGNKSNDPEEVSDVIDEALKKFPDVSESYRQRLAIIRDDEGSEIDLDDFYEIYDWLCETLLGYPVNEFYAEQDFFCRVFEKFAVYHFPTEVADSTPKFT